MKFLIFADDLYEEMELHYPRMRLIEAGYEVEVVGEEAGKIYKGKYGYPVKSDLAFKDVVADHYAGLVIPGGFAPDKIRKNSRALEIIRELDGKTKIIAFICHGGWVPISAKILKGKKVTGYSAIRDDLENAGAIWHDQEVVVDGHLISSRTPRDLPAFMRALLARMD